MTIPALLSTWRDTLEFVEFEASLVHPTLIDLCLGCPRLTQLRIGHSSEIGVFTDRGVSLLDRLAAKGSDSLRIACLGIKDPFNESSAPVLARAKAQCPKLSLLIVDETNIGRPPDLEMCRWLRPVANKTRVIAPLTALVGNDLFEAALDLRYDLSEYLYPGGHMIGGGDY